MTWLDTLTSETAVRWAGIGWAILGTLLTSEHALRWLPVLPRRTWRWLRGKRGEATVPEPVRVTGNLSTEWNIDSLPPEQETLETLRAAIEELRTQLGEVRRQCVKQLERLSARQEDHGAELRQRLGIIDARHEEESRQGARRDAWGIPLIAFSIAVSSNTESIADLPNLVAFAILISPVAAWVAYRGTRLMRSAGNH